jgi:spermidine synthase
LVLTDPRLKPSIIHIFIALFPVCALLGYLTPALIDRYSLGDPKKLGFAYGVNIFGCILGPLCAGYLLLPYFGVKYSLILLAIPFFAYALYLNAGKNLRKGASFFLPAFVILFLSFFAKTYEDRAEGSHDEVRRDTTATVIATGTGLGKKLLVNGIGITVMTPITKIMAHFPLAIQKQKPESALVICFGMGTTFRSLASWKIKVTAAELVPSVKESFGYYFADAAAVLSQANVKVIIDDGRRYLKRTTEKYDLITLDPPPPLEAAGSSLLYSRQFYDAVKSHLKAGGLLQQWFPGGDVRTFHSFAKAIHDAFPYVKVFHSIEGWGYHFIASETPFTMDSELEMVNRMPESAKADLIEWFPGQKPEDVFRKLLAQEITIESAMGDDGAPMLTDQRPYNEYYILRRIRDVLQKNYVVTP